ncbi:hypothetical protein HAZT_HAZT001402 [Hyalella azteca]|uniref:Activating signal cointegrator 1 n=1 Tax=Hyalella azteca TaxID=294128 RepID=A0A6A0HAA9_HYAAZ|nr:activating signal cointegrator 1 [Hyalella azteca]KAA0202439.1 hypothetical protein HAZT_HAZT001402 [Hyalella azteca]
MSDDLENWACAELDSLGLPDASTIIQYLKPLEDPEEVESFLNSMLDITEEKHYEFIQEFLNRQAASKIDSRFYRKSDIEESKPINQAKKKNKEKNNSQVNNNDNQGNNKKSNKKSNEKENQTDKNKDTKVREGSPAVGATSEATKTSAGGNKKKAKYVNLYTSDQEVVMLSGRHKCDCLASKHGLINNCLFCGRIVCEQEGAGPCLFCGNEVQSNAEKAAANSGPLALEKPSADKKNKTKVTVKNIAEDIQKAVEHKNKLLEYDRTSEKRTKVYDDECDYFNSNSRWLSKGDREKMQALENEMTAKKYDRSENRITIDLLGRKIITDETNHAGVFDPDDPALKAMLEHRPDDIYAASERSNDIVPVELPRPVYTESETALQRKDERQMRSALAQVNKMDRLQDSELQEMSDQGKCLSMHQPWASLLIAGIKKHEGRSWYSHHRGRLWIASTAKTPTMKDIESLESFYRMREQSDDLVFPLHYPPGCLLGCVDVTNVLSQEEYQQEYPDGESDSPYVFICKDPKEMIFKFSMKGQHKIYNLDPKIHQAAKKALK